MHRRSALLVLLAGAVLIAACEPMTAPVRPTPYDFRLAKSDSVFHWPESALPVRFYAEPIGRVPEDVMEGLRQWQRQFLYGELSWTLVPDSADADVVVRMASPEPPDAEPTDDTFRFVCEGLTILPARVTDEEGRMRFSARIEVYLNWFPRSDPTDVANCLRVITAHEIGHTLGIFGHSERPEDLMYPQPSVRLPSSRDRSTVQTLYHLPTDILPWIPSAGAAP
jgi:predicted Zn-dependent protease